MVSVSSRIACKLCDILAKGFLHFAIYKSPHKKVFFAYVSCIICINNRLMWLINTSTHVYLWIITYIQLNSLMFKISVWGSRKPNRIRKWYNILGNFVACILLETGWGFLHETRNSISSATIIIAIYTFYNI